MMELELLQSVDLQSMGCKLSIEIEVCHPGRPQALGAGKYVLSLSLYSKRYKVIYASKLNQY